MVNVFFYYRQNARSSRIEWCSFFADESNQEVEYAYLSGILKNYPSSSRILVDSEVTFRFLKKKRHCILLNISRFDDSVIDAHTIILLSDRDLLTKLISNKIVDEIYFIHSEGDFKIDGVAVSCDCGNCILSHCCDKKLHYQYEELSEVYYYEGIQYSHYKFTKMNSEKFPKIIYPHTCKKLRTSLSNKKVDVSSLENFSDKEKAYNFYKLLGKPKFICAPMVDLSEPAFRMMVRHYGADLCYTPMILSDVFLSDQKYRDEQLVIPKEDRPLGLQFSANNINTFVTACKIAEKYVDFIDLNLGCPQPIGRRHYYGSWLMEDWELIYNLISSAVRSSSIPITCKIRIFDDIQKTIEYAQLIEKAGASILTVHGRTRDVKMNDCLADWDQIKAIKSVLQIPVFSNGNIREFSDIQKCLDYTKADGVMVADALLTNPLFFSQKVMDLRDLLLEYLDYAIKYHADLRFAIPHILQISTGRLEDKIVQSLKNAESLRSLRALIKKCVISDSRKQKLSNYHMLLD